MQWIFLSPHLDDAALSSGGFIAERVACGDTVEIWSICAGDPPAGPLSPFASELHRRWGTGRKAIAVRRAEDIAACQVLKVTPRHFSIPDCIYRRDPVSGEPLIHVNEDLFRTMPESQESLVDELVRQLTHQIKDGCQVVAPMTLGNHIDHQMVRQAAERLNVPLWYYADYPYAAQESLGPLSVLPHTRSVFNQPISRAGLHTWQSAVAEYKSQISTFWVSVSEMEKAIQIYWADGGGCNLWGNSVDNA